MEVTKRRSKKNRKTKKILVFNEQNRIEYLTGFRKRKKERQQHAKEERENRLKEDKRALKQQRKELLLKSQKYAGKRKSKMSALDDIEDVETSVVDLPAHTVTLTDISEIDLAGHSGLRLGVNKAEENEEKNEDGSLGKLSEEKLKNSLKKLRKRQGEIDSRIHPSKKTRFQKTHPKQYDKKSLKKRKEKFSHKKQKKKIKPRN
ncbi:nucleolar protein 12-like [Saccostrea echinata]|uniref:nucleolar protein 12-like n=1 Tax=Saccostrea echinata TaxID=191078 RepID=UPI002A7F3042|nr:nucleolar protein 12-like [Saccostrea echinata]